MRAAIPGARVPVSATPRSEAKFAGARARRGGCRTGRRRHEPGARKLRVPHHSGHCPRIDQRQLRNAHDLVTVQDTAFDVAVIGGGINGASAAQQLAAAGYRTLIVDRGFRLRLDRAIESTAALRPALSRAGRSVFDFVRHPGRFVEALRMARQAMQARHDFVESSPSSVNRMRFCFPIYHGDRYRGWQLDAAFKLLSLLGPADPPLDYERLAPEAVARRPLIRWLRDFDALHSVAVFREYQLDWPERICMDAVLEAERLGVVARNHTLARLISRDASGGWSIGLRDMLAVEPEVCVRAKLVLNMAGIWIDDVNRTANPKARRKVLGTKGCHIVVRLPDECRGYGIATLNSRQEPFYCIPWHDLHYFGPTETVYDGDRDRIQVTEDEIEWIISEANRLLPALKLTRAADVISTWAGVRPLTYDVTVPAGRRSREIHNLESDGPSGRVCHDGRSGHDQSISRPRVAGHRQGTSGAKRFRA